LTAHGPNRYRPHQGLMLAQAERFDAAAETIFVPLLQN
jgi:hypothetical protein